MPAIPISVQRQLDDDRPEIHWKVRGQWFGMSAPHNKVEQMWAAAKRAHDFQSGDPNFNQSVEEFAMKVLESKHAKR